jgi:hypothetical protein
MAANRIRPFQPQAAPVSKPASHPQAPAIPPGFAVCPPQLAAAHAWQLEIYRLAYEQAKAATAVPRFHRMLFSVWN